MKKIALMAIMAVALISCNNDDDSAPVVPVNVDFNFTHNWEGTEIVNADFETTQYTNAAGTVQTLSKLVYLISDITFTDSDGNFYNAGDYNLVNARQETGLSFTPVLQIPPGNYSVSFTFGFDDEDNIDSAYPDLNATAEGPWGVPMPLGGGYHYMRLEGKYLDDVGTEVGYAYHAIRANDMTMTPLLLQDTSFVVNLGTVMIGNSTDIEIKMDVSEWFNPWDLPALHSMLMPNFDAQISMSENGLDVFSLGTVTQ